MRLLFIAALLLLAAPPANGSGGGWGPHYHSHIIKNIAERKRLCGYIDHTTCKVCRCGYAVGDKVWTHD